MATKRKGKVEPEQVPSVQEADNEPQAPAPEKKTKVRSEAPASNLSFYVIVGLVFVVGVFSSQIFASTKASLVSVLCTEKACPPPPKCPSAPQCPPQLKCPPAPQCPKCPTTQCTSSGSGDAELEYRLKQTETERDEALATITQLRDEIKSLENERKKFYVKDIESSFGVKVLESPEIDEPLKETLSKHTLKTNEYTFDTEEEINQHLQFLLPYLDNPAVGKRPQDLAELYYIRFVNEKMGYGLFAARDLPPYTVLGEYTGVISIDPDNTDYVWEYPGTYLVAGENVTLGLDARLRGNALRFVNDRADTNTDFYYVPYNNIWHIFYFTTKHVRQDEQFFVSYGEAYWNDRNKDEVSHSKSAPSSSSDDKEDKEDDKEEDDE